MDTEKVGLIANNQNIQGRVQVYLINYAHAVLSEAPIVSLKDSKRIGLASAIISEPAYKNSSFCWTLALSTADSLIGMPEDISDQQIQQSIEDSWDSIALVLDGDENKPTLANQIAGLDLKQKYDELRARLDAAGI